MSTCACPLCGAAAQPFYQHPRDGEYYDCGVCRLVFLAPAWHPDPPRERARYCLHENSIEDSGYCRHLGRLLDALTPLLPAGAAGLDYGCGPQPALAELMRQRGFAMQNYDPFFQPDAGALERRYDFIACSETAEHFRRPGEEFARLAALLKPGGVLGVMTSLLEDGQPFASWAYRRDFTHLCFYRRTTMDWIARRHAWQPDYRGSNVVIFSR